MANQFFTWDDFIDKFGQEMACAGEIHQAMVDRGLQEGTLSRFDFAFESDRRANLEQLKAFLLAHYPYSVTGIEQVEEGFELSGVTADLAVTADNLMYWALDMLGRGYEFDARFGDYGAEVESVTPKFAPLDAAQEAFWFDEGLNQYQAGNRSGALISWSHVIAINPRNADAWYSRAIAKNDLRTWKAALRDYDEALRIAPDFWKALVNRGGVKDDNGDYAGAIEDYTRVIDSTQDKSQKAMAYFNRGNSRFNLEEKAAACKDWNAALALGADYARERITQHCRPALKVVPK